MVEIHFQYTINWRLTHIWHIEHWQTLAATVGDKDAAKSPYFDCPWCVGFVPKISEICKRPFTANIKRTAAFDFLSCRNLSGLTWVHPTGKLPQKNPSYCSRHLHIYSCVGIWQNDRVEIIPNDQGDRKTPSFVSFSDSECLIGDAAKNRAARNPHNTCVAVSF